MSAIKNKVAGSLIWTLIESFGVSGVAILTLIFYARFLSPDELGATAIALGIIQVLLLPIESLFQVKLVKNNQSTEQEYFVAHTSSFILSIILAAVCFFLAPALGRFVGDARTAESLQWMALCLPFMGLSAAMAAWLKRDFNFKAVAVRSVAGRLIGSIAGLILCVAGWGIYAIIAQQILMVAVSAIILWILAEHKPRFCWQPKIALSLAQFGWPSTLNAFLTSGVQRLFMVGVGAFAGTTVAGYFNLAFRTVDMLRDLFAAVVAQMALPMFAKLQGDKADIFRVFEIALYMTCALMFPVFAFLGVFTTPLIQIVYGYGWDNALVIVTCLSFLVLPFFTRLYVPAMLNSLDRQSGVYASSAIQVLIISLMFFADKLEFEALLLIWILRYLIAYTFDLYILRRLSGMAINQQLRVAFAPLLSCLIGLSCAFLASTLMQNNIFKILLATVIFTPIYIFTLRLLSREYFSRLIDFILLVLRLKRHE